ncbi:MAG: polymer-forming cytoskeletal protein [Candidatus Omnitrophota bacterium]
MRKRKFEEAPQTEDKILDVNASMQGTLRFDDPVNLRINGKFEGALDTKGRLMIGHGAEIKANITGESISVAGRVKGNIKAVKELILEENARLEGDIETPRLSVADGAVLNGRLKMVQEKPFDSTATSAHAYMSVDQLAKYLEVDRNKIKEWANNDMLPATRESGEWVFERSEVDQWIAEGKVKA